MAREYHLSEKYDSFSPAHVAEDAVIRYLIEQGALIVKMQSPSVFYHVDAWMASVAVTSRTDSLKFKDDLGVDIAIHSQRPLDEVVVALNAILVKGAVEATTPCRPCGRRI